MPTDKTIIANSLGSAGLTVATSFGAGTLALICDPTVTTDDSSGTDLVITPANFVKGAIGNVTGMCKLTAGAPSAAASILEGSSGQLNLAAMSDPGSPAAGDLWYSSSSGLSAYKAGLPARVSTVVFEINSAGTPVANTAAGAFTSIFGGLTPPTFPANSLKAGTILRIYLFGKFSNTGTPTLNWKVLLGSTAVLTGAAVVTGTGMANNLWIFDRGSNIQIQTAGASGTAIGYAVVQGASSGATAGFWALGAGGPTVNAPVTLDTTVGNALDVQVAWGAQSASNTLTLLGGYVEALG